MKKLLAVLLTLGVIAGTAFANGSAEKGGKLLSGNLRIVIGSKSTGGDTYQNSVIVAQALAKQLGMNVKVDAVGVTAAFQALDRSSDGHTIMIFHDQSYLGYLYGVSGYKNIFKDYTVGPTVAINPGNAFLAPKKSKFNTISDVINAAGHGEKVRVAIQPGGVSEIGFTAMKNAVMTEYPGMEKNLVAVNTGSQSDKNQALFDGLADVINGSVQANEQYTHLPASDQRAMKFLWLTARRQTIEKAPATGYGQTTRAELLKYVTPNSELPNHFTFDKEFFILYNKKMSPKLVAYFDKALTAIFDAGQIQKVQEKAFFIPDFMPSAEAQKYLQAKMERYRTIIDSLQKGMN